MSLAIARKAIRKDAKIRRVDARERLLALNRILQSKRFGIPLREALAEIRSVDSFTSAGELHLDLLTLQALGLAACVHGGELQLWVSLGRKGVAP